MLTRIFKRSDPASTVIIIFLFALIRIPAIWISPVESSEFSNGLPLFHTLFDPINAIPVLASILASAMVVLQGIFLNAIINNSKLNDRLSNAGLGGYLLMNTVIGSSPLITPELIAFCFIIPMIAIVLDLGRTGNPLPVLFNAGLLAGIAAQFYLPAVTSVGLVFMFLIAYRSYNWRELIIPLIGFLFPFACAFTYCFVQLDLETGYQAYINRLILFEPDVIGRLLKNETVLWTLLPACLFLPAYRRTLSGNVVRVRKALIVFALLLIPAAPAGMLQSDFSSAWLMILAFTLTLGFTFSIHQIRKAFFSGLILLATFGVAIYNWYFIL